MITKIEKKWEPYVDPATRKMRIGKLSINPTSTITALLYGFARNESRTDPEQRAAREYYFWRICDMWWNRDDLPESLMERHPWAERIIKDVIENKYLSVGGSASSSKSHTLAAWSVISFMSNPANSLVLVTSTTLREARKRIWGSIITLLSAIDDGPFKIRDSIGSVAYVNEKGQVIDKAGISLIAAEKSKTRDAVGKFVGIKQKYVTVVADELGELSEAIINACVTNLSKNPHLRVVGLSNPNSRFDAFGVWSEPADGWDSVDVFTADSWKTKWKGKYIRLDGERSPNILEGKTLYPYLPTEKMIAEDKELLGEKSRGYMRMVRAIFFDSDESDGIYSEPEIVNSNAMTAPEWGSRPIPVAGLDPSFTNGGDRTCLYLGWVGYDKRGQFVFQGNKPIFLAEDSTDKSMPRTYQIAGQVKEACIKYGVEPRNLAIDATGAGSPFCDVIAGTWSNQILRVQFGGKASNKRVTMNSKKVGHEMYSNRVSELWFVGKELMRTKQIYGVTKELAKGMTMRTYELVKSGFMRVIIESKPDFKERLGQSPDEEDAFFLALDVARQRHGLTAMEMLEDENNLRYIRKPRSFKSMNSALTSGHTELLQE